MPVTTQPLTAPHSLADALLHAGSDPRQCRCQVCVLDRTERHSIRVGLERLLTAELYTPEAIARICSRLRCGASVGVLVAEGLVDESDREAIEEIIGS